MSLFKIRQFWSITSEDDEYFDQNSLIVAKFDSAFDYIVTASQSGVLRIFNPTCDLDENGRLTGFNPNDVIVEQIFDEPILQISSGRLVSGSQSTHLAVLHPKLLSIFTLVIKTGKTEHGQQSTLQLIYEHKLKRSAANFAIGSFGGSQNRDFICVQSLDGLLTFFEQESQVSHVAIPDFLLPGPLVYSTKTDNFILSSSDWSIVSYKYKTLSETADAADDPIYSKPNICPEWTHNLGESIIDMKILNSLETKEIWVMILGERNLFCLSENGKLKFMKKLDYCPICFYVYLLDGNICTLIVAETDMLLIYQTTTLMWSAHLDYLPISISRAFLKSIKGSLVLLSEEGRLECCYLGTEPSLFVAPPVNVQELNFDKVEEELQELNKILKNANSGDESVHYNVEKEFQLLVAVDSDVKVCTYEHNIQNAASIYMCSIQIDIIPKVPFQEVQIAVLVRKPLKVVPDCEFFTNLSEKTTLICHAFLNEANEVPSLEIEVRATVISNLEVPRILTTTAMLPISLVLEACSPEKDNKHKVTLSINQNPVGLSTLFSDYLDSSSTPNAIAFKSISNKTASIILAKSSERYRLQSDSILSLSLLVEQLIFRLKKYYGNCECKVSFSSTLPAIEVFKYVNEHFEVKNKVNKLQENLSQLSAQYRLIQKRLISKYRAKNPTTLKNLELLLNDTYDTIIETTKEIEEEKENLNKCQTDLSCTIYLLKQLVNVMGIESGLLNKVNSIFSSEIYDLDSQCWEDVTDASICYLLSTDLAKTEKDRLRAIPTSSDQVKDISKFKKHFLLFCERLSKHLDENLEAGTTESDTLNIDGEQDSPQPETNQQEGDLRLEKPIGNQFAESNLKLLRENKSLIREKHKINEQLEETFEN